MAKDRKVGVGMGIVGFVFWATGLIFFLATDTKGVGGAMMAVGAILVANGVATARRAGTQPPVDGASDRA
jgi:hypothetical protein